MAITVEFDTVPDEALSPFASLIAAANLTPRAILSAQTRCRHKKVASRPITFGLLQNAILGKPLKRVARQKVAHVIMLLTPSHSVDDILRTIPKFA